MCESSICFYVSKIMEQTKAVTLPPDISYRYFQTRMLSQRGCIKDFFFLVIISLSALVLLKDAAFRAWVYQPVFPSPIQTCKQPTVCCNPHPPIPHPLNTPKPPLPACNLNSAAQWTNRSQGVRFYFFSSLAIFLRGKGESCELTVWKINAPLA